MSRQPVDGTHLQYTAQWVVHVEEEPGPGSSIDRLHIKLSNPAAYPGSNSGLLLIHTPKQRLVYAIVKTAKLEGVFFSVILYSCNVMNKKVGSFQGADTWRLGGIVFVFSCTADWGGLVSRFVLLLSLLRRNRPGPRNNDNHNAFAKNRTKKVSLLMLYKLGINAFYWGKQLVSMILVESMGFIDFWCFSFCLLFYSWK